MNAMKGIVDNIQCNIFEYNINELNLNINNFVEEICKILPRINEKHIPNFNQLIGSLNDALDKRDYLLYADILEYEFLPFLNQILD